MIARTLIALAVVAALLLGTTASTLAGPATPAGSSAQPAADAAGPATLEGEVQLTPAMPVGYYVWHNAGGWHLRTHGPGQRHHFVARLHTDGVFADVDTVCFESRDRVAILDGGHTLVFDVHTHNWTDGVNFRVRGGSYLRFALALDGKLVPTDAIHLGPAGKHPPRNPFVLRRP